MKLEQGFTSTEMIVAFWAVIAIVAVWGWVWNIIKLVDMCCDISGMLIVRAAGIFVPPLGAVMGFL